MNKVILIGELQPGMFVNRVTKQLGNFKVKSQGLVKTEKAVEILKKRGILELEVDLTRSNLPELEAEEEAAEEPEASAEPIKAKSDGQYINEASKLYDDAKVIHKRFNEKIKSGEQVDIEPMQELCGDIVSSLFANKNALSLMTMIKDGSAYQQEHSMNCAIYMTVFAKHMGFDRELIEELCLGGLMMDIGMVTIPDTILQNRNSLSKGDWDLVKSHVDIGLELIEQCGDISDVVLSVISHHQERLDGSGYPAGKMGDEIPIYGRMAAIVDSYDAMTSNRAYRHSVTSTNALKKLLGESAGKLDQSLIQQFIKCIGVHPVGSLVKLKSGKLAIVVRSNANDPLNPMVMTFYSVTSGHHTSVKRMDLSKVEDEIACSVRPEEFKINLNKFFKEVFLGAIQ